MDSHSDGQVEGGGGPRAEVRPEFSVESVRAVLGVVRARLGLDVAWVSGTRDGSPVFEVVDGEADCVGLTSDVRRVMSESYHRRMIDGHLPAIIQAPVLPGASPVPESPGLAAVVAIPVLDHNGTMAGVVCGVSRKPRNPLTDLELRMTRQTGDFIGTLLGIADGDRAATADQRAVIRKMVLDNDFDIVFQSVHDVTSGAVLKVEALARFPCAPFRPDAVIAQATQMGVGFELETAILRRVVAMVPQVPDDVLVTVNISPAVAMAVPWDEVLVGVDPSRIVLELTEHDAVHDYGALEDVLEPWRERGVRIAVDDAGAGFSSFSHVLELSPEFVKIDRSITHHIDVDDARRRLAHALAELAGHIGATVVAEGVENQGELDAVAAVGITAAQGHYLSRPRPLAESFAPAGAAAAPAEGLPAAVDVLGDRRFELALAHSPIGMAVVGLDGTFLRTNRPLRTMLGYSKRELENLTFQEVTHPDDLDADVALLNECVEGRRNSYRIDKRYITADGRVVWGALTVVSVHAPRDRPRYFVSQIVDVTADRARQAELARQAAADPLTGLANRSAGWSRLEQLEVSGAGYAVLLCDIDRFRAVNDSYGHRAGNQLLIGVADRLADAAGDAALVARWGGDQFLIVADFDDEAQVTRLADHITERVSGTPIRLADGTAVSVGLTVGSAVHRPGDGRSIDALLEEAHQVTYGQRRGREG